MLKMLIILLIGKNLENVILIGHSMSGDIILETALKNNKAIIGLVGVVILSSWEFPVNRSTTK